MSSGRFPTNSVDVETDAEAMNGAKLKFPMVVVGEVEGYCRGSHHHAAHHAA